jgi:hypothetical protein
MRLCFSLTDTILSSRRSLIFGLLLSLACGIEVNFISAQLHPRFEHHLEALGKEQALVRGEHYVINGQDTYWPEFQNRILFAAALQVVSRFDVLSPSQWYGVLRLLFAVSMFVVFWFALTRSVRAPPRLAAASMLLLAFVLGLHFNHGWEHPSDYLDPIFMTGFLWATLERRAGWLFALSILAALNRESAVFGGLIWGCAYGVSVMPHAPWRNRLRINWRDAFIGGAATVGAYATILGARRALGGSHGTGVLQHTSFSALPGILESAVNRPAPDSWPLLLFAILVAPVMWIATNRRYLGATHRGILAAGGLILIVSSIFSLINELRMLIPLSVLLIYVAVCAETIRQTRRASAGHGGAENSAAGRRTA